MLVLAPTRELGVQIADQAKDFGEVVGVRCEVVYGGVAKHEQVRQVKRVKPQILIATPGRLVDLLQDKAIELKATSLLVLDEADRMLVCPCPEESALAHTHARSRTHKRSHPHTLDSARPRNPFPSPSQPNCHRSPHCRRRRRRRRRRRH